MSKFTRNLLFFLTAISLNFSITYAGEVNFDALSDHDLSYYRETPYYPSGYKSISGVKKINNEHIRIGNDIYRIGLRNIEIFSLSKLKADGYSAKYLSDGKEIEYVAYYHASYDKYSMPCEFTDGVNRGCFRNYRHMIGSHGFQEVFFSYYWNFLVKKVATCKDGESFDPEAKKCFADCTDVEKNKWGLKDGRCIDCSGAKTDLDVFKCFCGFHGSTPPKIEGSSDYDLSGVGCSRDQSGSSNSYTFGGELMTGKCENINIDFCYKPIKPNDNNNTKPDKPKDPKPNPNPKDPKPNPDPNNPGGGGGGGGGGTGHEHNENPKDPKDPKNPGDGKDDDKPKPDKPENPTDPEKPNDGKDDNKPKEPKFDPSDFDDGGLEKERNNLYNDIKGHINNGLSKFDGLRNGIDQFINNIQGKGFDKVQAQIKQTCPFKKDIPLPNSGSNEIVIDLCKAVSPASEISYYAFYIGFAIGAFLLFLKLLVFSI